MQLLQNKNVFVQKDKSGNVTHLEHIQSPYVGKSEGAIPNTDLSLCQSYMQEASEAYNLPISVLSSINTDYKGEFEKNAEVDLRLKNLKKFQGVTTIEYQQCYKGLEVWRSGISVNIHNQPLRVSSSSSSYKYDVNVDKIPDKMEGLSDSTEMNVLFSKLIDKDSLVKLKKEYSKNREYKEPVINGIRYLVYPFKRNERYEQENDSKKNNGFEESHPTLPFPPLSKKYKDDAFYIVKEILFTMALPNWGELNWRAFVDPQTNEVLYLRAFVSNISGMVFDYDPMTSSGTVLPSATQANLNLQRSGVTLEGLTAPANAGDPQDLNGEYVSLQELVNPNIAAPTNSGNFNYNGDSDNFSAVNAYYHCDRIFRMIKGWLGSTDFNTYFDGVTFPVPVDHRGENNGVNAHANGNTSGNGIGRLRFGLAQSGQAVGIATDYRVVLHEFGHVLLHDNVSSPNFGFAHSAGDSLAAILSDPNSALRTDANLQWETFPFIPLLAGNRRHDRSISSGWAWGGSSDTGGYNSEQILSTTLFRAYRSIGGGHSNSNIREFAARFMAYLIVKSIGTLTPSTNPTTSEPYATALMNADLSTDDFEGIPGGWVHKVIRWAFENQGAFQPAGAPSPVTTVGDPESVDVYIDDGRNGEYQFQQNFWNTTDIWNRTSADGMNTHITPILDQTNYLYIKVKNRGTQSANNVVVKAYHNKPGVGLVWPDSWQSMTTAQLNAGSIASGAETIVGPFEWTPAIEGHECLLAVVEADGDASNTNNINAGQSIAHWRLVPFDNNIAQRNVAPVPGSSLSDLIASLKNRVFWLRNPFKAFGKIEIIPELPELLVKNGWSINFSNPGGAKFSLQGFEEREINFTLIKGRDINTSQLDGTQEINIYANVNGMTIGGMTYHIDPTLSLKDVDPYRGDKEEQPSSSCSKEKASDLMDCLGLKLPSSKIKKACVSKITLDIELDNDCC